jgi:hypothetical protein
MEKARSVLAPIPAYLSAHPAPTDVPDKNLSKRLAQYHASAESSYWSGLAEFDEREKTSKRH